jgi:hypothetical protein
MEIINLFILLSIYYLINFLEFYQKFLLIVGSSMFVSLLTHNKIIEEKSKDTTDYRVTYIALHNIIQLTFFISSFSYKFYNNMFKIGFVNTGYQYFKKINNFYVIGRNKILTTLIGIIFSAVVPLQTVGMSPPPSNRKIEVKEKNDVFKDNNDMNIFLDSLVKEKVS